MILTIEIADATDAQRVLDGLCEATNYPGGPMSKGEWVKEKMIGFLRSYAKRGEIKANANTTSAEIDAIAIT